MKVSDLERYVKTVKIEVKVIPIEQIKLEAIPAYNNYVLHKMKGSILDNNSNVPTGIIISYIRHVLTNYEKIIKRICFKKASQYIKKEMIHILKLRVISEIKRTYAI